MNIKKLVSAVVASAIMVTSASSLATSVAAYNDPALMTLKEYNANAELKGYTAEELEEFPLKTLLDSMTYAEDVYEETPEEEDSSDSSEAESDTSSETESDTSSETESNTSSETENEASQETESNTVPETKSSASSNTTAQPVGDNEPTIQAATERVKVHSKGDKMVFPEGAKYVWVGNEEYSIYDTSATVDLLRTYSDGRGQYTLSRDIIVGSAKQLDPDNEIYHVNIDVSMYSIEYEVKFYTLNDDGTKDYFDLFDSQYSYFSRGGVVLDIYTDRNLSYYSYYEGDMGRPRFYFEVNPKLMLGNKKVDAEIEHVFWGNGSTTDSPLGIYIQHDMRFTCKVGDKIVFKQDFTFILHNDILQIEYEAYDNGQKVDGDYLHNGLREYLPDDKLFYLNYQHLEINVDNAENKVLDLKVSKLSLEHASIDLVPHIIKTVECTEPITDCCETLAEAEKHKDITSEFFGDGYSCKFGDSGVFNDIVRITVFIDAKAVPTLVSNDSEAASGVVPLQLYFMPYTSSSTVVTPDEPTAEEAFGPDLTNEYFRLNYVTDGDGMSLSSTRINSDYDSYYQMHHQGAIVYGDADMSDIKLEVSSPSGVTVGLVEAGGARVDFDRDTFDFSSGEAKQFTVAANGGQGNYFVNIMKAGQEGAKLAVYGPDEREVFFDYVYGDYHDILLMNLGNEDITNLKVELKNAKNVVLNDFWKLDGSPNNSTLKPYSAAYGDKSGLAKIRLQPELNADGTQKDGEVEGTLVITADGQETRTIKLKGYAGDPSIVTPSPLANAVKFVPYSSVISSNNIHPWIKTHFEFDGSLPAGLSFDGRSGEIYGTPQTSGTYRFYIYLISEYRRNANGDISTNMVDKPFILTVVDNTDENVFKATDSDYSIKTAVGTQTGDYTYYLTEAEAKNEHEFTSNGEFGEFMGFWLNGVKLALGTDYDAESGSTKITIKSQTMSRLAANSTNTIAAEFRVDGDLNKELKRTAQNFTIGKPANPNNPDNPNTPNYPDSSGGSGSIGDSDNSGGSSTTTPESKEIVFTPENPDDAFKGAQVIAPAGTLPEDAKLVIKLNTSIPADKGIGFDITFTLDGKEIQPNGNVLVKLPIPEELKGKTIYVYHIEDGKYVSVDFRIEGDFVCFYANHFSTYVISGKKLDSNGSEITADAPGTSQNPVTGIGISAAGLVLSAALLTVVLAVKKKKR